MHLFFSYPGQIARDQKVFVDPVFYAVILEKYILSRFVELSQRRQKTLPSHLNFKHTFPVPYSIVAVGHLVSHILLLVA